MTMSNMTTGGLRNPDMTLNDLINSVQPPKSPGTFRRILGAAAGVAGNAFAPGMGSILSSVIGGAGLNSAATDPAQYLQLQQQINAQSEAFQSISNVLRSKHESAMAAINNLK
jgi:hypothetical protein